MRPVDPRLLRAAGPARASLAVAVASGLATAALILLQAGLLAHVLAHATAGWAALHPTLLGLGAVLAARALTVYGGERAALRAAAAVQAQLRGQLLRRALSRGPGWLAGQRTGELATLLGRGLDALDGYFARYLPQLVLATVVPAAVLVRVALADPLSAVAIGVTIPLVPLFMVLIGLQARARTARQWQLLARLGGHFLDVVEGLATLQLFGRARAQVDVIRRVSDSHRRATMATLRVAFLSALVLELLATLSVAVVAVEVGLRLLAGHLPLQTALLVLLLAPEAFLPLRAVGTSFHASMEGATAAAHALDLLDTPPPAAPAPAQTPSAPRTVDLRHDPIRLAGIRLRYDGRNDDALAGLTLDLAPGEHVAVVGPSGAGKSSLLALLLGFVPPTGGRILVGGVDLREVDLAGWRRQIAWVPQNPHLFAGTVADNVRLADPDADDGAVRVALARAGAAGFVDALPAGLATPLAESGHNLSTGQRQRIALARAFLRDAPLVLLDEPTAHLDADTAAEVRAAVRRLMAGRTVVVVAHTHGWVSAADRVLALDGGRLVTPAPAALVAAP